MDKLSISGTPYASTSAQWRYLAALLLFVCIGAYLRVANLATVHGRSLDEQYYTEGANALLDHGAAGLTTMAAMVQGDEMSAHNPVRAGYLYLLAGTMQLVGRRDIATGTIISCAASIASLLLLAALAWRRFSPASALTSTLLYAVSPLALMTSRRTWEESLVELLALALIFVATEITAGSRHLVWSILFALITLFGITVKQTVTLSIALCAAWILVIFLLHRERRQAIVFLCACVASALVAFGLLAHLLGGVHAVLQLSSTKSLDFNPYSIAYENGPPWFLFKGLWAVTAITTLLVFLSLQFAFDLRPPVPPQRQIAFALVLFCAAFFVPAMLLPHHLNLRYVAAAYAPFYLLAGVGFAFLLDLTHRVLPSESTLLSGIAFAATLFVAYRDYATFRDRFVQPEMDDLSIRMVLHTPAPEMAAAPVAPLATAAAWIAASATSVNAGRNEEAIAEAQKALAIDPGSAAAWNNIAAANENMQRWDEAIHAANEALKLQPDFQLAKNNLRWSEQQRAKARH